MHTNMCMVIYSSTCNIFLIQILFSLIFLNKFLKICFIILLYTGSMLLKKYLYETHYVISYMHAHNYELYKQDYEMTELGYFFDIAPH